MTFPIGRRRGNPALPPPKPYAVLKKPRPVPPDLGLPSDLSNWYSQHEGIGLAATGHFAIRLGALAEVRRVGPADGMLLSEPIPPDWAAFDAFHVASLSPVCEVVYVLSAPGFRFGNIVALGISPVGLLRALPVQPIHVLVLDLNFAAWVRRLDLHGWTEPGLQVDVCYGLSRGKAESIRRHYMQLNVG